MRGPLKRPPETRVGKNMKEFARRIAVVIGAVAMSVGLMGAVAAPADAAKPQGRDTSWGW